jgi:hypothetical protein
MRILKVLWLYLGVRLRAFWIGALVPSVLVVIARTASWPYTTYSERLQLVSTILQLAGLALVAAGYLELRTHFGRKPVGESIAAYFRDFWRALRGKPLELHGTAVGGSVGSAGHLGMVVIPGPKSSLERRVELLETNFKILNGEVTELRRDMSTKYSELTERISAERVQLETLIRETRTLLEKITVGGLGTEAIGWMWLVVSTAISGFAPKVLGGVMLGHSLVISMRGTVRKGATRCETANAQLCAVPIVLAVTRRGGKV